ncbi:hypothetical protein Hanom_Chr04g00374661 [Helianthus anomalus]
MICNPHRCSIARFFTPPTRTHTPSKNENVSCRWFLFSGREPPTRSHTGATFCT